MKKLTPNKTCTFCGRSWEETGGRRMICSGSLGMTVTDQKNYQRKEPVKIRPLNGENSLFMAFWGKNGRMKKWIRLWRSTSPVITPGFARSAQTEFVPCVAGTC